MTIFYPDLSSYQAGYIIPKGTPAVVAKATEGTYYLDSSFHDFQHQATMLGIPFSGYHFLKAESSPEAQAQYYYNFAGKIPCMIDVETEGGSRPGVDWCVRFINALHALGGRVWSVYYPRWYLGLTGGSLGALGVPVIASEYRSYDDNNWPTGYGGITPLIWQYTSTPIDMNAFKGTAAELSALINGDNMNPVDVWAWRNPNLDNMDMRQRLVNAENAAEAANAKLDQVLALLRNTGTGGASAQAVAAETLAELKAKL